MSVFTALDWIILFSPLAFCCLPGWFYCRALLAGIASARDDQHRLTPTSPWFYFDRAFKPGIWRVWAMTGLALASHVALLFWAFGGGVANNPFFLFGLLIFDLGWACSLGTFAVLWAPRFSSAGRLMTVAWMPGAAVYGLCPLLANWGKTDIASLFGLFFLYSCAAAVSFLFVQGRILHAKAEQWFRFPQ